MVIDGRAIAEELKEGIAEAVRERRTAPTLVLIVVGSNPVTEQFIKIKKKFAEEVGVLVSEIRFPETATSEVITKAIHEHKKGGIIVQLPLPYSLPMQEILNAIPTDADVDALSSLCKEGKIFPPVVAAMQEILARHEIPIAGKEAVVVGAGKLVGGPAAKWLQKEKAKVQVVDEVTKDLAAITRTADIVVLGAGVPGLLKPEMVKEGVIILDAGTSEQGGKIVGDADPRCAEKAALFTPTPGGIGPITVAMVFRNLLTLT